MLQGKPVLQVPVATESERGLLGIAIMNSTSLGNAANGNNNNYSKFVFLYYTESKDGMRVYRYEWKRQNQNLANPILILDLPALPGPIHDGGKLAIGPDRYLYAVIGPDPDDTSVILRVNPYDGSAAKDNPFINNANSVMHKYFAYGFKFDPNTQPGLTGLVADTQKELSDVTFGTGFGAISDLNTGPGDGFL